MENKTTKKGAIEKISIEKASSNLFTVRQGKIYAENLSWDEAIGLVISLTMPERRPCLQWMKTEEEHRAWRERIASSSDPEFEDKEKDTGLNFDDRDDNIKKISMAAEAFVNADDQKRSVITIIGNGDAITGQILGRGKRVIDSISTFLSSDDDKSIMDLKKIAIKGARFLAMLKDANNA